MMNKPVGQSFPVPSPVGPHKDRSVYNVGVSQKEGVTNYDRSSSTQSPMDSIKLFELPLLKSQYCKFSGGFLLTDSEKSQCLYGYKAVRNNSF